MTTVTYNRGECRTAAGVFKFTEDQIAQIAALLTVQERKPDDKGSGVPIYQYILDCISTTVLTPEGLVTVRRDDVDPAVYAWIAGAVDVNRGVGFYADYIREYTRVQYRLRGGVGDANIRNQQASNAIAFRIAGALDRKGGRQVQYRLFAQLATRAIPHQPFWGGAGSSTSVRGR